MRPDPLGFQKPSHPPVKSVGLATITDDPRGVVMCSCRWSKIHVRKKVREEAAEKHLTKKHNGRGVWL